MLDEDTSKGMNIGFNIAGGVFATGAAAHYVKTAFIIGLFTNSIPCAIDCTNAASWCFSYKNQISDLLGGTIHDGLVTLSSQQLPSVSCSETIYENRVLNNLEVKEYPLLNHATMDFTDAPVESKDKKNAKTYANTTVIKWLEK